VLIAYVASTQLRALGRPHRTGVGALAPPTCPPCPPGL